MIPSSRPKLSDLYTISKSKLLENHTLHSGTYPYSPYMAVTPRVDSRIITGDTSVEILKCSLTHSPLNRPCRSRSFLPIVMSSVLMVKDKTNLCRVKRSFKPYQNEHNSFKDTGERSKKQRDIDLKISMKILFHCPPTFPFT